MTGRGPWHNNSTVRRDSQTPLGHALIALLTRLARAGAAMPSNRVLSGELGCCAEAVSRLLLIMERDGVLVVEKRGKTFGLQRRVTIVATNLSTAPMRDPEPPVRARRARERSTLSPHAVPKSPPVRDDLRVVRTRCPRCNLPPDHSECRHRWNGATTAAERRAIAAEAGRHFA